MKRLKDLLLSEKGIVVVNIIMALGFLFQNVFVLFAAYALWLVFLVLNARKSDSKMIKIVYAIIAVVLGIGLVRSAIKIIELLPILLNL